MIPVEIAVTRLLGMILKAFWTAATVIMAGPADYLRELDPFGIIQAAWIVFALYWLAASVFRKRTQKRQSPQQRLLHVVYMIVAASFLFETGPIFGILDRRFLPELRWAEQLGAAMTVAGVAFAIWARNHIGRNWSGTVTIKEDHQLIRTGPYSRIRHPIYTGILFGILGTAIDIGEYRGLLGFVLIAIGFAFKAKGEEKLLAEHFGADFEEHKRATGFFLPKFS
jgi:protein-S-isoprenylcysteine O-methyltransferase Ste14